MKRFLIAAVAATAAFATPVLAQSQLSRDDGLPQNVYTSLSERAAIHFAQSHQNRDGNRALLRSVRDETVTPSVVVIGTSNQDAGYHTMLLKGRAFK
jgi:hypothetical protein